MPFSRQARWSSSKVKAETAEQKARVRVSGTLFSLPGRYWIWYPAHCFLYQADTEFFFTRPILNFFLPGRYWNFFVRKRREFQAPTLDLIIFNFGAFAVIKHKRHWFLVRNQRKMSSRQEMMPFPHRLDDGGSLLLHSGWWSSLPLSDLDMNATGRPRWLSVADTATSDASHSTTKGGIHRWLEMKLLQWTFSKTQSLPGKQHPTENFSQLSTSYFIGETWNPFHIVCEQTHCALKGFHGC